MPTPITDPATSNFLDALAASQGSPPASGTPITDPDTIRMLEAAPQGPMETPAGASPSTATATALAMPATERIQSASSDRPLPLVGTLVPQRYRIEHRSGMPDASLTPSRHQQTRRLSPQ